MTDRIGISLSRHMPAVSGLMTFADQAIYRTKQSGKNRFQFFQESQQVIEASRVTVVAEACRGCELGKCSVAVLEAIRPCQRFEFGLVDLLDSERRQFFE